LHDDYFDEVMGTSTVRTAFNAGTPWSTIVAGWTRELDRFAEQRRPYFLYGD
jgi:uncharacterized protein YbbC (DUF1343 family)